MLEEDSELLERMAKYCKDVKEALRLRALRIVSLGYSVSDVAEMFDVEESTIYDWIKRWIENKKMDDKPRSGRPEVLSKQEKEDLKEVIEKKTPKDFGINAYTWTTKEIRIYLLIKGINISREEIRRTMRELGAHYVKAEFKYLEADKEERLKFAKEFLENLKDKPANTIILFEDECSICTSPRKGYGWTFNERLTIDAPQSGKERLNCFGAVDPINGEEVVISSKIAKVPTLIKLLIKILIEYPDKKIIIYLDNSRVHHANKVKAFLKKHKNIELRFMPSYSPDLNPQEYGWNLARTKFLNNHVFKSAKELASGLSWFWKKLPAEEIINNCTLQPILNIAAQKL